MAELEAFRGRTGAYLELAIRLIDPDYSVTSEYSG
jgi:hypothetical protein